MLLSEDCDLEPGVKALDTLKQIVAHHKDQEKSVVHCHGVFDLLHIGHIRHLQSAREQGALLVVTITPDRYVNKGPDRPAFHEDLRAEALAALDMVDYVAINRWPNAVDTIRLLEPSVYVKGSDYEDAAQDTSGGIVLEREAIEAVGGRLHFTHDIQFSSSALINRYLSPLAPEVRKYLAEFGQRYNMRRLRETLESLRNLNVLVLGETIIDEYHYCKTMGKSGKEPVLAARFERGETFAGGVLAVANHLASVCDNVNLLTFMGQEADYDEFVRERLSEKVSAQFLRMNSGRTIVKRRFVESYPFQKLFEIYLMDNDEGDSQDSRLLCEALSEKLSSYDAVIVVDYGHGMISEDARRLLCRDAKFLAVNTQINAGNRGFNTVSKYPRADFISLSEHEMRMDARRNLSPLQDIVMGAADRLQAPRVLVTRGSHGSLCWGADDGFHEVPAFSGQTVDRVGAGDAVLAVTSLLAQQEAPMDLLGVIGNAVGCQAVQTVGNRRALDKLSLLKFLEHAMK